MLRLIDYCAAKLPLQSGCILLGIFALALTQFKPFSVKLKEISKRSIPA